MIEGIKNCFQLTGGDVKKALNMLSKGVKQVSFMFSLIPFSNSSNYSIYFYRLASVPFTSDIFR